MRCRPGRRSRRRTPTRSTASASRRATCRCERRRRSGGWPGELTFPTPRDEYEVRGARTDPTTLPAEFVRVYERSGPAGAEYGVIQEVVTGPGLFAGPTNFFPAFRGTPAAFTFSDAVTGPGLAQLTCRTIRDFLACRVIRQQPRSVAYRIFHTADGTAEGAPTDEELRALFADQRWRWSFRAPDAGPWRVTAHWRRVAQIIFVAGTDELAVDPIVINPIPKELRVLTRTVRHRTEVGIIEWADRAPVGGGQL